MGRIPGGAREETYSDAADVGVCAIATVKDLHGSDAIHFKKTSAPGFLRALYNVCLSQPNELIASETCMHTLVLRRVALRGMTSLLSIGYWKRMRRSNSDMSVRIVGFRIIGRELLFPGTGCCAETEVGNSRRMNRTLLCADVHE